MIGVEGELDSTSVTDLNVLQTVTEHKHLLGVFARLNTQVIPSAIVRLLDGEINERDKHFAASGYLHLPYFGLICWVQIGGFLQSLVPKSHVV